MMFFVFFPGGVSAYRSVILDFVHIHAVDFSLVEVGGVESKFPVERNCYKPHLRPLCFIIQCCRGTRHLVPLLAFTKVPVTISVVRKYLSVV